MGSSNKIESLVYLLAKLPGLGPRSARRALLHMLKFKETFMMPLADSLKLIAQEIVNCKKCGNMDVNDPCSICENFNRNKDLICVVETVADLWAIEKAGIFDGYYHVLGGNLSVNTDKDPVKLNMNNLLKKAQENSLKEVIIATNATIEGQTTAYYITELLTGCDIKISRLAHGIPMGAELDYLDEATLSAALQSRRPF